MGETLCRMGSGGAKAAAALLKEAESDWRVAKVATFTLGRMGKYGASYASDVAALLRSNLNFVRWSAMEALQQMGDEGISAAAALIKDSDWKARKAAVETLGRIGEPARSHVSEVAALVNFRDSHELVCEASVASLRRLGQDGLVAIASLLQDVDWRVRHIAL